MDALTLSSTVTTVLDTGETGDIYKQSSVKTFYNFKQITFILIISITGTFKGTKRLASHEPVKNLAALRPLQPIIIIKLSSYHQNT